MACASNFQPGTGGFFGSLIGKFFDGLDEKRKPAAEDRTRYFQKIFSGFHLSLGISSPVG